METQNTTAITKPTTTKPTTTKPTTTKPTTTTTKPTTYSEEEVKTKIEQAVKAATQPTKVAKLMMVDDAYRQTVFTLCVGKVGSDGERKLANDAVTAAAAAVKEAEAILSTQKESADKLKLSEEQRKVMLGANLSQLARLKTRHMEAQATLSALAEEGDVRQRVETLQQALAAAETASGLKPAKKDTTGRAYNARLSETDKTRGDWMWLASGTYYAKRGDGSRGWQEVTFNEKTATIGDKLIARGDSLSKLTDYTNTRGIAQALGYTSKSPRRSGPSALDWVKGLALSPNGDNKIGERATDYLIGAKEVAAK